MNETEDQRERRATDLAFAAGKRQAEVDGRLNGHDQRFAAINGSIEKHARNAAALQESMEAGFADLKKQIAAVAETQTTRQAVEEDRVKQVREANEKQIRSRDFWFGVLLICATIVAALIVKG